MVLYFDFFSAKGGPLFYFFEFLLEEREGKIGDFVTVGMGSFRWCGGVHIVGKEKGLGWVSILGRSEVGEAQRREERVGLGFSWGFPVVAGGVGIWGRRTEERSRGRGGGGGGVGCVFQRYNGGSIFSMLIHFFFLLFLFNFDPS